jgi:hypothetical protein
MRFIFVSLPSAITSFPYCFFLNFPPLPPFILMPHLFVSLLFRLIIIITVNVKGKGHPRTGHEDPEVE